MTADELDQRFADFRAELDQAYAPGTVVHDVKRIDGWRKLVQSDGSFGRLLNGPQWISGVAVRDGAISGDKLAANLVISNTFTTVDTTVTPTADRMELDATSLRWYGTVAAAANTKIVDFGPTGFTLGKAGATAITYVASTGVLTVPAAVIGSLTIAAVGSGLLGGTYKTAASGARLELSTTGLLAYNSGGTNTINMDASTGDLTVTGTFTIQSATSAARVEIKNTGIKIYDTGGTVRAQILNDGSGFVGSTSGLASAAVVAWTSAGVSTVNATAISTGSLNGALLSSGTVADSAVAALSANKITAGSGIINALTIGATLTLGSGGKIIDADGSYWDQTGITLVSAGTFGDTIRWRSGGVDQGSIYSSSGSFVMASPGGTGGALIVANNLAELDGGSSYYISASNTGGEIHGPVKFGLVTTGGSGTAEAMPTGGSGPALIMSTDDGATFVVQQCRYFVLNVNGTDVKVPYLA